jgi:predicted phosphodiesterase
MSGKKKNRSLKGKEEVRRMTSKDLSNKVVRRTKPIRLNRTRLNPKKDKDYAELMFWGDIHYGHPACDIERAKRNLDYCVEKGVYIIGMGDYIEAGLRESIGDSVYAQELNPDKQADKIVELLEPVAKAGLLVGLLRGNHEARIIKETSVDITRWIARTLGVPYLGMACWNLVYVGNQSYTIYALHGASGSRFQHTKMKALMDISHNFEADVLAMGHVHDVITGWLLVQKLDKTRKMILEKKKVLIITGHYLSYDNSYAQEKGWGMGKMGSPKVKLFVNKHDMHASE